MLERVGGPNCIALGSSSDLNVSCGNYSGNSTGLSGRRLEVGNSLPLVTLESVSGNVALLFVLGETPLAVPQIFPFGGTASQSWQEY